MADPQPSSSSAPPPAPAGTDPPARKPTVVIVIGMAGSGKTTFVQRLNSYLHTPRPPSPGPSSSAPSPTAPPLAPRPPYLINLDPAVTHLPYEANVDVRDTVAYKEVMRQYNLGPNGGILTALNLFTTKFDQVLGLMERRAAEVDYIILDTPGQIEIFTWSASGAIITDAVAASFPTVVAYVIDTPRTTAPATFMSNMLYACSILYKTRLPFLLIFNKTDVTPPDFALEWMHDFEAYQAALARGPSQEAGGAGGGEPTYMNSLMNSMSLVLDEFYKHLNAVGVSSLTGDGVPAFFEAVESARGEYEREYLPELERLTKEKEEKEKERREDNVERFMRDLKVDEAERGRGESFLDDDDDDDEEEEEEGEEEEGEGADFMRRATLGDSFLEERARRGAGGAGGAGGTGWRRPG